MAAAKKKASAKRAANTKAPARRAAATKRTPAKKQAAAKATRPSTTKRPAATKKAAKAAKAATKRTPAKRAATKPARTKQAATKQAATKRAATKPAATKPAASKRATSQRSATTTRSPKKKAATNSNMATTASKADVTATNELPKPRFNKDGLGYTKDFDLSFVKQMHDALQDERVRLTGQAKRLEDEAHQLVEEAEMGDVQFDDEGGEGDTMVVERERDLALSAQAREAVTEIDAALERITKGTYGYSIVSGRPIPRERLEAIPWSTVLVEEKVGGIGRR